MSSTPFWPLFWRALRGRCPICARGPLYHGVFRVRHHCPLCGYRYQRTVEYGSGGYLSGAVTLNVLITGVVPLAALVYIAATRQPISGPTQLMVGLLWTVLFPIVFHRVACAIWLALDLRLNPPLTHELAAAPPASGEPPVRTIAP